MDREEELLDEIEELKEEILNLKSEVESYREQREDDVTEMGRLESEREEIIDWQGKACSQIQRVLDTWEYEIDANIVRELEALREVMISGLQQMGEL